MFYTSLFSETILKEMDLLKCCSGTETLLNRSLSGKSFPIEGLSSFFEIFLVEITGYNRGLDHSNLSILSVVAWTDSAYPSPQASPEIGKAVTGANASVTAF